MRNFWVRMAACFSFFMLMQVSWASAQSGDEILAKIGKEVITRTDFETRLKSFPIPAQETFKDVERKKLLLDQIIKTRLLFIAGESKGLQEKPDLQARLRMIRDDFFTQEYVHAYIENSVVVSDEEMETYYNTDPQYRDREYLKVSQIVVGKEEEAKEILESLKKGQNFKKLAKERSIDKFSQDKAGELDWFETGKKDKEIEDAVEKLEKDGISAIVKTKGRYTIFKLDDRRTVSKTPFPKAKNEILGKLKYKKISEIMEKEVDELKKKLNPEIFYDKLSAGEK